MKSISGTILSSTPGQEGLLCILMLKSQRWDENRALDGLASQLRMENIMNWARHR